MTITLKKQNTKQKGSLLFEMLIVISLVAIILSVGTNAMFLSMRSSKASGERDVANTLASGALESTKAITEENWQNIYSLTKNTQHYYPSEADGKWVLVEGDETININNNFYARYIVINNVSRDGITRDIESNYVSDNDDPSAQKVTVTISWSDGSPVVISEYFFRWRNKICNQTEWTTAEPGNAVKDCPSATYEEKEDTIDLASGSIKLNGSSSSQAVKILVVAGGGGGGTPDGGGGGAGGYIYESSYVISKQTYTVTVGDGGNFVSGTSKIQGGKGGDSSFDSITAEGGGGGGGYTAGPGGTGGSGGGGGGTNNNETIGVGGTGTQGQDGGSSVGGTPTFGGGGGGGAVGSGQNGGTTFSGVGGIGLINPITGSVSGHNVSGVYYFSGGGGGGSDNTTGAAEGGVGGYGGGGKGGYGISTLTNGVSGTSNTGGGGGGAPWGQNSGVGGSGIVIISYVTDSGITATGGIKTVVGANTIHTFTASGTFGITMP